MPHVITVVRYYSGGKASWGKGRGHGGGTLVPPYVAKSFVYLGRAVLGLEGGRGTVLPRPLRLGVFG